MLGQLTLQMTHGLLKTFYLGDLNQDGVIDEDDYDLLNDYVTDPIQHPLTAYQRQLADLDQSGEYPNSADLACLRAFLDSHPVQKPDGSYEIPIGSLSQVGYTGMQQASTTELLEGFTVKLYILRTEDYDSMDPEFDDAFSTMIISDLREYKVLPLDIIVDLHSIHKYYWSLQGKFVTKVPLSRDELQDIIVEINRTLRFNYAPENVEFNSSVDYREVITKILEVDNRILMVDLEPIQYEDDEGKIVSKETVTGRYTQIIKPLDDPDPLNNLHYTIQLENAPILPRFISN